MQKAGGHWPRWLPGAGRTIGLAVPLHPGQWFIRLRQNQGGHCITGKRRPMGVSGLFPGARVPAGQGPVLNPARSSWGILKRFPGVIYWPLGTVSPCVYVTKTTRAAGTLGDSPSKGLFTQRITTEDDESLGRRHFILFSGLLSLTGTLRSLTLHEFSQTCNLAPGIKCFVCTHKTP